MLKIFNIFIALCILISLVSAQPIYKQNTDVELNIPCTINGDICSNAATCQFSIVAPSGNILLNLENMTQNSGVFSYQLYSNQTIEVGQYEFPVTCCDGVNCGTRHLTFLITPSGLVGSSGEALTYVILIFVVLTLLTFSIIGGFKIKSKDSYDMGGNLLEVNYGKYLKMGLFFLGILFLWTLLFLGWQTSEKILMFDFTITVFRTAFLILTYLIGPMFIAFVALALIQWTADLKLWELHKRGLRPR